MSKNSKIQKMNPEELKKWYTRIKPMAYHNSRMYYLRPLTETELEKTAYTMLNEATDYPEEVDFTKLAYLKDVKMLHTWGYYGFFKPTIAEVLCQIPKDIIEKVVAFEIINGPLGMTTLFKQEWNEGYHVSVVRLYQSITSQKHPENHAHPVTFYPSNATNIPIGMNKSEIKQLKREEQLIRTYAET